MRSPFVLFGVAMLGTFGGLEAAAQQATIATPMHSLNDSYYERFGVNWGFRWRNGFAQFGAPNTAIPPFGNYNPDSGLRTGIGFAGRGGSGYLDFHATLGSQRSYVGQTPMLTLTNGVPGFVQDVSVSPFVMGWVPVVGGGGYAVSPIVAPGAAMLAPGLPAPGVAYARPPMMRPNASPYLRERLQWAQANVPPEATASSGVNDDLNLAADPPKVVPAAHEQASASSALSSAEQAAPSVAEARRMFAAEQSAKNGEAQSLFDQGRSAEAAGNVGAAKVYYQMANRRASGELHQQIRQRLAALERSAQSDRDAAKEF